MTDPTGLAGKTPFSAFEIDPETDCQLTVFVESSSAVFRVFTAEESDAVHVLVLDATVSSDFENRVEPGVVRGGSLFDGATPVQAWLSALLAGRRVIDESTGRSRKRRLIRP